MPAVTTAEAVNTEIRAGMARRRLSQADLGKALGISQAQVSKRLIGHLDWRLGELRIVSDLLRVPLPRLIEAADANDELVSA